jgi:hypothetical protein
MGDKTNFPVEGGFDKQTFDHRKASESTGSDSRLAVL